MPEEATARDGSIVSNDAENYFSMGRAWECEDLVDIYIMLATNRIRPAQT